MLSAISYHSPGVSFCLLLLRITLGVMIAAHGMNKIFGGGKIAGTAAWFDSIGMKPGVPRASAIAIRMLAVGSSMRSVLVMKSSA